MMHWQLLIYTRWCIHPRHFHLMVTPNEYLVGGYTASNPSHSFDGSTTVISVIHNLRWHFFVSCVFVARITFAEYNTGISICSIGLSCFDGLQSACVLDPGQWQYDLNVPISLSIANISNEEGHSFLHSIYRSLY